MVVGCNSPAGTSVDAPVPPTQSQSACEPFFPHSAEPLSLEAAREAHFWDALQTEWRLDEQRAAGHLVSQPAQRLEQNRRRGGDFCLADTYTAGRLLFEHAFNRTDGLGHAKKESATEAKATFRRVHRGRFGGPDANSCRSCHWRGGLAGAGAIVDNAFLLGDGDSTESADSLNPPALHGAGVLQALAAEMTKQLAALQQAVKKEAKTSGEEKTVRLRTKGVDFGVLRAKPDGALDTSEVVGIDADLVVRPFGWKGNIANLRTIVEESFQIHLGMQSEGLVQKGDRELIGKGPGDDPDEDGVTRELREDQITAVVLFLAAQGVPVVRPHERLNEAEAAAPGLLPPTSTVFLDEWLRGRQLFETVGCASCHVPSLVLKDPMFRTVDVRDVEHTLDLSTSMERPRIAFDEETGGYPVFLFSDLRRHNMGKSLQTKHEHRGVETQMFQTPPLWGVADSGPWMHDGRAQSIEIAIREHGGEAAKAREAFEKLSPKDAGALQLFLISLRREMRWLVP